MANGSEQMNFLSPPLSLQKVPGRASGQEICLICTTALSTLLDCSILAWDPQLAYVQNKLLTTSKTESLNTVQHVPQNSYSIQPHHPLLSTTADQDHLSSWNMNKHVRSTPTGKRPNFKQSYPSCPLPPCPNTSLTSLVCASINHSPCSQNCLSSDFILDKRIYLCFTQM